MKPEIDFVEFVAAVKAGSFSKAALEMGVSKSHVSKRISCLEKRLGIQLMRRSTRKLALTDIGREYYQRCTGILDDIRESESLIIDTQAIPYGVLNLNLPNTFGEQFIAPLVSEFMIRHRQLKVNVTISTRNADLIEEGVDIAVRIGDIPDSRLVARQLCATRWVVGGNPDYLKEYGVPQHPDELQNHACLVFSLYGVVDDAVWVFNRNNKEEKFHIPGVFFSNNGDALLAAARKGVGLIYLPEIFMTQDIESSKLCRVLADWYLPTTVSAVYPYSRHLSPKVRQFIDLLVERLSI